MKDKKYVFMISILLLLVGIGVCVCLFFSFGKNEKIDPPSQDEKDNPPIREGYNELGDKIVVEYGSKEEVYDVIVDNYLKPGESIVKTREENGCWYYDISNNTEVYFYCVDDPVIRVIETHTVKVN